MRLGHLGREAFNLASSVWPLLPDAVKLKYAAPAFPKKRTERRRREVEARGERDEKEVGEMTFV
jgi:hypothetical protein